MANNATYPKLFNNSPLIVFTKKVGDDDFKQMIQATIEHTINTLAGEVDLSHRDLAIVLTRANTKRTGGYMQVKASPARGVHLDAPMEIMINIGAISKEFGLQATIIHEVIHYLQYQLKVLSVTYGASGASYLWDSASGYNLEARAYGGKTQAMFEACVNNRTWRDEPRTTRDEGVTAYNGVRATTPYNLMRYLQQPCEAQAHTLPLIVARRMPQLNLSAIEMQALENMASRQLQALENYQETQRREQIMRETWTVVHR